MDSDDDWKKLEYKNWVRGAKGLEYLQKGLQNAVAELVVHHRDQIVQSITSSIPGPHNRCNQCTRDNLLPEHAVRYSCRNNCIQGRSENCFGSRKRNRRVCPHGLCSKLYDEIVNSHRHKDPLWTNTDPSTWCSDPAGWSFAKCFQTTRSPGTSSSETDAAGLLSIILNDTYFKNKVACNWAAPNNYFSVAREMRNTVLHSPKMELHDNQLQGFLDTFIVCLQDHMFRDDFSREAVQSLVQLKNNKITISLSEEVKLVQVRLEALRALEQLQEKIQEGKSEIAIQSQQAQSEIKKAASAALDEMDINGIRQQLIQTEEKIKHLTNTIQELKMNKRGQRSQDGTKSSSKGDWLVAMKNAVRDSYYEGPCVILLGYEVDFSVVFRDFKDPRDEKKKGIFRRFILDPIAYRRKKKELRKGLIEIYRSHHSKFHLSPILEVDDAAPLLQFYVMPNINIITSERAFGGGRDKKEPISDLGSVFYKEGGPCREIYLTADAGFGKTSFSKRLALTWCQAKNPTKKDNYCLEKKEIRTMDEFDFVFLVFLRDSLKEDCHIIDMVLKQIVQEQLELETISREDLRLILDTERCLVILDGLDEWSHPENSCKRANKHIPHRKANQCTVLTTTRPWKLSGDDIEAIYIDQKLEIAGLSEASADSLKKSAISHLCAGKEEHKRIDEFNKSVKEKKITNLIKNPIMLMYILCLFCENREFGKSLCMLYSNITDMLFYRTVKIHKKKPQLSKISQSEIPQCFKENEFCIQFYTLLAALGKLAFHTIFVETREENTLVFDNSVVDQFLNEDCLEFCLKTGILTRSNVRGKLTKQETKVSFAHKTVHEFFAALCSTTDPDSFQEKVLSKCKCVKDILEMSNILIFVSGVDEKLSSSILTEVINVVNNDPVTHEYRNTLYSTSRLQLKEFQDLCISCCREFTSEFQHNLCLQDVFLTKNCQEEQYREHLKQLTTRNTQDIRSLLINMNDMYKTPYNTAQKAIDYFVLRDLVNIEKIHHRGIHNDTNILPLLNSSVKSLSLWCGDSWSHLLFEKMTSLQTLEVIDINMFKMNHSELSLLFDYISQRYGMKEIVLANLSCTDSEKYSCTGHSVDLSQHLSLRKLVLDNLPLAQVVVNMSSLEKCGLQYLCKTDLVLEFQTCTDCKLEEFSCNNLKSSAAIDSFLDTLPLLHHVQKVQMWKIDLGTRNLTFSSQVKIKRLVLADVTMKALTMRKLVDLVQYLSQSVTVGIWHCTISPEKDFKALKKQIKSMQRQFMILKDDRNRFEFRTIEDGD